MSGGTRCNVTHAEVSEADFHGGSRHVIARVLRAFTPAEAREWFEHDLGVPLKLEESGKYFPVSDDAQTVLDALLAACARAGVEVRAGARVVRIARAEASGEAGAASSAESRARSHEAPAPRDYVDVEAGRSIDERIAARAAAGAVATRFTLGIQRVGESAAFGPGVAEVGRVAWPLPAVEPDELLEAEAIVLACGGLSFPRTGSDGTGYALAMSLGHTLVPPVPALTPLTSDEPWCVMLKGLTAEVELTLRVAGRVSERVRGSMLWTHFGYSGPAALDLSRHWLRAAASDAEVRVTLSVVPGQARESLEDEWVAEAARDPKRTARRFLGAWMPDRLAIQLCAEAGVGPAKWLSQVPRESRARLLTLLTERPLRVDGTLGYEKAEATAGGVPLAEVDPSTLESRACRGLYLCGEMLDVEGRLGGFNFQWAWSSGTVAGRCAGRRAD
jgi:predicted flavoprotein YhiN